MQRKKRQKKKRKKITNWLLMIPTFQLDLPNTCLLPSSDIWKTLPACLLAISVGWLRDSNAEREREKEEKKEKRAVTCNQLEGPTKERAEKRCHRKGFEPGRVTTVAWEGRSTTVSVTHKNSGSKWENYSGAATSTWARIPSTWSFH